MLDTGWRMEDGGYWMLVEDPVFKRGYWILDTGCKMEDAGWRIFDSH